MNPIDSKVIEIIKDKAGIQGEEITLDAHLFNDVGLDSLDIVELTIELENAFNFTIPDQEVEGIETIRQIVEVLEKKLNKEI